MIYKNGFLPDRIYSYEESLLAKKFDNNDFSGIIYCTVNLHNGNIYIGKDSFNNPNYIGGGKRLHYAFKKYGRFNFKKFIIDISAKNEEELNILERKYIILHLHKSYCYNISPGGDGPTWWETLTSEKYNEIRKHMSDGGKNKTFSHEHIEKLRISSTGKKHTQETKEKIRIKNTGKKFTEEHKKHISESTKGRCVSEETKRKISEFNKGKKLSEETKEKLRILNTGRKLTEEQKIKLSIAKTGHKDSIETKAKKSASHKKLHECNKNNPEYKKMLSERTKHRNELYGNPMQSPKAKQKLRRTLYKKKLIKQGYNINDAYKIALEKFPLI